MSTKAELRSPPMPSDEIRTLLAKVADTPEIAGSVIDDDRLIEILTGKSFQFTEAFAFPKTFQSLCIRLRALIEDRP